MNPNTGHLVDLEKLPEFRNAPEYEPVPAHLYDEAVRRLAGKAETYVPKQSRSPLARHAAERRKAKRKAAKLARRRNRR